MNPLHPIGALFHRSRLDRDMAEEMAAHPDRETGQNRVRGLPPDEARFAARRAFGAIDQLHGRDRAVRGWRWLEELIRDGRFAFRQLNKRKLTSAAAILSLAVGIGACTAAFRLIDALLLRPLPVANAERLYAVTRGGTFFDGSVYAGANAWAYPAFVRMCAAVKGDAELLAVADAARTDLTYGSDQQMEKGRVQYVSGRMFDTFGLRPVSGRLLTGADDLTPAGHACAVLAHDYWVRRFGSDPRVVGRTFRMADHLYEIIGVAPQPFTGTEPGTFTDLFIPITMNPSATRSDSAWFRTLAVLRPGVPAELVRTKLDAASRAFEEERSRSWTDRTKVARWLNQRISLEPAAAGASAMQRAYRGSLLVLGGLVALVLLIACANVANLLLAEAATREREMALRISLGAGRRRLIQLVLVESALLALLAAGCGLLFAEWTAPFVVNTINPPDNPARLALPLDWRVFGFGAALTGLIVGLFGLAPAVRASAVKPAGALKGGTDPRVRHRLMHALIAAQIAFCLLVVLVAGLFVVSFDRLSRRPTGFSADRLLTLEAVAQRAQPASVWDQLAEDLRTMPGVEAVALAGWPLLSGQSWNGTVSIDGVRTDTFVYFLNVSSGWLNTMRIPLLAGRDFQADDRSRRVALVNREFARRFFNGTSPVGRRFSHAGNAYDVVGLVDDVPYFDLRQRVPPQAYFPFHAVGPESTRQSTLVVRTSAPNSGALASLLRRRVAQARPDFRVDHVRTQAEIDASHTVRERLLARLASFFGFVALLLAGIGMYGVLDHSVQQRRREIGIRLALGAQRAAVLGLVVGGGMRLVGIGALGGLAAAFVLTRSLTRLLYGITPTDPTAVACVTALIALVALLACWLPARRALTVDPIVALRAE